MRVDAESSGERYRVGDLVVDVPGASVSRAGERILLPPRTFELLVALVRLSPRTVRRQELLETVWRSENVTDQTLSHRIMVLRRALGDRVEEPVYVVGERGFGYRLLPTVVRLQRDRRSAGDPPGLTRLARLAFTTAGFFPILGAALVLVPNPAPSARGAAVTLTVGPVTPAEGSPDLASLADDLRRLLESGLERVRGLRLVGPGATEVPEMRLEGTLAGPGATLEARVRLVDLRRRRTVWERTFTGGPYALLDVRRTMLVAILEALAHNTRLRDADSPGLVSPCARRACLRGEVYWFSFTENGLRRSAQSWSDAVAVSPESGAAHAGAALAAATSGLLAYLPPREAESVSRAEASRALALDPGLPSARLARGLVRLLFDLDVPGAADELGEALAADPDDPRAALLVTLALQARGRLDDSVRLVKAVIAEDPHLAAAHYLEGRAHEMAGRWGDGEAAFARALALEPDLVAARRGQAECLDRAHREAEALVVLGRGPSPDRASAGQALREAWRWSCLASDGGDAVERVRACLLAGEPGRASRALAAAFESRSPAIVFVPWDVLLEPLRGRPAFRAVLDRLGGRGRGPAPG